MKTTPASRLYNILDKMIQNPKAENVANALSGAVGFDVGDPDAIALWYGEARQLYHDAIQAIEGIEDIDEAARREYLSWREPVGEVLDIRHLLQPWHRMRPKLSGVTMQALKFACILLEQGWAEDALSEDDLSDLEEIREAIGDLISDIMASDELTSELKLALIAHLNLIQQAILAYELRGVKAFDGVIINGVGLYNLYRQEMDKKIGKGVLARYWEAFWGVVEKASKVSKVYQLAQAVKMVLEAPNP